MYFLEKGARNTQETKCWERWWITLNNNMRTLVNNEKWSLLAPLYNQWSGLGLDFWFKKMIANGTKYHIFTRIVRWLRTFAIEDEDPKRTRLCPAPTALTRANTPLFTATVQVPYNPKANQSNATKTEQTRSRPDRDIALSLRNCLGIPWRYRHGYNFDLSM